MKMDINHGASTSGVQVQLGRGTRNADAVAETGEMRKERVSGERINDHSANEILPPGNRFIVNDHEEKYFKKFGVRGSEITVKVKSPPEGANPIAWLEAAFSDIYEYLTRDCRENDFVGIGINSANFGQGEAGLSFRRFRDLSREDLWNLIQSVTQSNAEFKVDESFTIKMSSVRIPAGRGGDANALTHEDVAKKSILQIKNDDNLCFPRSLVTAIAYAERGSARNGEVHKKWNAIRNSGSKIQRDSARDLVRDAGVVIPDEGCGIREITQFQQHLARIGYAIVVYEFSKLGRGGEPLYDGKPTVAASGFDVRSVLNILYYERARHFNPILNLRAAAASKYFCAPCNRSYRRVTEHRCVNKCPKCLYSPQCDSADQPSLKCDTCDRLFFGVQCLTNHRQRGSYSPQKSICETLKICKSCTRLVDHAKSKHVCGMVYCKICCSQQPFNHRCYMTPLKRVGGEGENIFVFYDFETDQSSSDNGDPTVNLHVPNLCVAHQVCSRCIDAEDIHTPCPACGLVREFVFKDDPVKQFVEFATRKVQIFKKIICIAHNSKGFDGQFILRHLVEKMATPPKLIMNGTSVILIETGHTRFIDSMSYMPMALSALPKAFGLPATSRKGTFPHFFNTEANKNYVGPLPAARFYSPDTMSEEGRAEFYAWYDASVEAGYIFDFQKEIVEYCKSDVDILRRACIAFRRIFLECGRVCPFFESTTIASACSRVFRKKILIEKRIGIVPPGGYRLADKQSRKAIEWLFWLERELDREIIHAGRSREFRVTEGMLVDGYLEEIANGVRHRRIFEFHGCYWHGCLRCHKVNRYAKLANGESMDKRLEQTQAKTRKLTSLGYEVTEIWECDFDRLKSANPELRVYVGNHPLLMNDALNPRDAFYGGRTGNTVQYYEIEGTEKIQYVDVCSLYPFISKNGRFPLGHPKVYIGDECMELTGARNDNITAVEGLIKCTVLPPRTLFHPVLPVRMHNRLMFALCRTCCQELCQTDCPHENSADREFSGTWVADELKKAVAKGYKVTGVQEIWQYEMTQFDPATRTGGHFAEYIDTFLRIKQESSGFPAECGDDASKERYIDDYQRAEGIRLNREKIVKNPGLRSVSKLCLNSFWGKFGMRDNIPSTDVIVNQQALMELLTSPDKDVLNILPVNDDVLYVCWAHKKDSLVPSPLTSVVIAAYTTALARLKLYGYLEQLDDRVLYYDTDSVIYVSDGRPGQYEPPTGNFLGDLTDELEKFGEGSVITKFASGGPKFYAFIVRTGDGREIETCKIKGITLNHETKQKLNFESVKAMVVDDADPIVLKYRAIRRTALHHVVTRTESKTCKPVFVKRRRVENLRSLPYGYKIPAL